jgi:hypothetical protein
MHTARALHNREKLLRAGAVFVLLAAVLPNITYLGHGPTAPQHIHAGATTQSEQTDGDHVQHCHVGPSKCSGPQSLVGTWWIGDDATPADAPERAVDSGRSPLEATPANVSRSLHPPQSALPV